MTVLLALFTIWTNIVLLLPFERTGSVDIVVKGYVQ